MKIEQEAFQQISTALANHFDSLYYVEIESGNFREFLQSRMFEELHIPKEGEDFFALSKSNAHKFVHPDDLEKVLRFHDKDVILENLKKKGTYYVTCRLIIDGETIHVRHIDVMCEDGKHILACMEDIGEEVREREDQKKTLQSVKRMARRDELTGVRNKNSFSEHTEKLEKRIRSADTELQFGVVMCDVNDLKRFNDTRGHGFGDEILQRASSMIRGVFQDSKVYRIGGDEFAVLLEGSDFGIREELLENLRRESVANGRSRSGPVVASGLAVFDPAVDARFSDVLKRADSEMYENKKKLKSWSNAGNLGNANKVEIPLPDDRRRRLDDLFGAMFTVVGEGYVFLNDLRYDYSRWSLSMLDDFDMPNEYMYHAGRHWQKLVHPDDVEEYRRVIDAVISGESEMQFLRYRVRRQDGVYVVVQPRSFILYDSDGNPEYFGGILVVQ